MPFGKCMSLSDALVSVIVGLFLLQTAIRLPTVWRGQRRERSLWGAFAAFAVAWWLRTDVGRAVIDPLGIEDLPTLLKHILAIGGICVLLNYVTDVYQDADASARHIRLTTKVRRTAARASAATVLCLTSVFFFDLDRSKTADDSIYFVGRHVGEPGLVLYLGLFNAYTAAAALVCAYQWGRAARLADRWNLRTGLAMMTSGMVLMALYAVVRTAYITMITVRPTMATLGTVQEHVTDTMLYLATLLWLLGSIAPASHAVVARVRALRALTRLHPLWRDVVSAVHSVPLHPPSRVMGGLRAAALIATVRDVVTHDATPQIRLGRYVTEIRDATHELRRRAPADLFQRARRLASAEGYSGEDAEAVAEAYWLKAALDTADAPAGMPAAFHTSGDDFTSEVAWLCRVARVYRRTSPHTGAILEALAPDAASTTAKE
ncbi:hypothetical protein CJD44_21125 [Streptomyces sp. alain-838]|nr:hypothetical protein CJD44_21125 [Streptomyces sp. alain-838]